MSVSLTVYLKCVSEVDGGFEVRVLLELGLGLEVDGIPDELAQTESDVHLGLGEDLVLFFAGALDVLNPVGNLQLGHASFEADARVGRSRGRDCDVFQPNLISEKNETKMVMVISPKRTKLEKNCLRVLGRPKCALMKVI